MAAPPGLPPMCMDLVVSLAHRSVVREIRSNHSLSETGFPCPPSFWFVNDLDVENRLRPAGVGVVFGVIPP